MDPLVLNTDNYCCLLIRFLVEQIVIVLLVVLTTSQIAECNSLWSFSPFIKNIMKSLHCDSDNLASA